MIDLNDTYRRMARAWTDEELAGRYREARRPSGDTGETFTRPVAILASAFPRAATVNVAIHVLHVLPDGGQGDVAGELAITAQTTAADALRRCHRALELDGTAHGYSASEWLSHVYEIAASLLESASPREEPPTIVRVAQNAISWLSRAVVELDEDSPEAAGAIAEALARFLVLWLFATTAADPADRGAR